MVHEQQMESLRARIAALEREGTRPGPVEVLETGLAPVDDRLRGGGLAVAALHEVMGADTGYGAGAAAWIAHLLARREGSILWCAKESDLYGPGLAGMGLDPRRLLLVKARRTHDLLWALEEGLRYRHLAAVVGEIADIDIHASRRLQLAAGQAAVPAFLLRRGRERGAPASVAETRWRVTPQPSAPLPVPGLGAPCFRLELIRNRRGPTGDWLIEYRHETHAFHILPDLVHRPQILAAGQGDLAATG